MLEAQGIEVTYGDEPVIVDLSASFAHNSFVGLIGPNGAGKTTLLLTLSGQFKPQAGRILFEKSDVYDRNLEFKQVIGYVHEDPFFYPYLRVEEFLHFVARVKKIDQEEIESQISSSLSTVNLSQEKKKLNSTLSMGMRKKLALAAALLGPPKILFLDEALNGIDVESAFQIKHELERFVANGGTIILSTHVLEVVEKVCDRYLVLKNGAIVADVQADGFRASRSGVADTDLESYVVELLKE